MGRHLLLEENGISLKNIQGEANTICLSIGPTFKNILKKKNSKKNDTMSTTIAFL